MEDLYEVCGQAARGAKWREYGIDALLRTLDRRAGKYAARNPGKTPYLIGSIDELYRIRERAPHLRPHINTVIAQPCLSAACSSASSPAPTPTPGHWPKAPSPSTAACRPAGRAAAPGRVCQGSPSSGLHCGASSGAGRSGSFIFPKGTCTLGVLRAVPAR